MEVVVETLKGKKVDVADVSTVSLRDIYLRLCQCRDFEISHVWQRAIFLTAFLLGCFTAYWAVYSSGIYQGKLIYTSCWNLMAFCVSVIGIAISIIWILMAKGSKAWYEVYEHAIEELPDKFQDVCDSKINDLVKCDWRCLTGSPMLRKTSHACGWLHRNIMALTDGGAFSVSRLNIAIGYFALGIWVCVALKHIILMVRNWSVGLENILLIVVTAVFIPVIWIVVVSCRSEALSK